MLLQEFKWRRMGMLYHNYEPATGKGNSPCFLTLSAVFTVLNKKNKGSALASALPFDETNTTTTKIKELLQKLSLNTRSKYYIDRDY